MTEDDILQHCLEEVAIGRETAAACAARYPQVPELRQQLHAAQMLMDWPPVTLRAATVRRHQAQLRAAVARQPWPKRPPALAWWPRLAMATTLVAVLVVGGVGTLSAAADSLPGHPLYTIKRAREAVQGAFVASSDQAGWHAALAAERLDELDALAAQPTAQPSQLQTLAAEVSAETEAALAGVDLAPEEAAVALLERLLANLERQQAVLVRVHHLVPAVAQASIEQALIDSRAQRESALERLAAAGDPPGDNLPPGLASRTPVTPTAEATVAATRTATMTATTQVPPGQARKTATSTHLPPGQANKTATVLAPGHERQTATAAAQPYTSTPPGNSGGQGPGAPPNCNATNPNSANYCTPTPGPPPEGNGSGPPLPTSPPDNPPTACPLNPAGQPVCSNRP